MPRRLVIIGCGGQGREIADIAASLVKDPKAMVGFVDDAPSEENLARLKVQGYEFLGTTAELGHLGEDLEYIVGIADGGIRERMVTLAYRCGLRPAILIHPKTTIGSCCHVGEGSVLWPGVRLTTNVRVGRHVHLNQNVTIGHDSELEQFSTVNPLASVSGNCCIGTRATLGTNSAVLQNLSVGADSTVGAGACVVKDVPPGAVVKGVPAK